MKSNEWRCVDSLTKILEVGGNGWAIRTDNSPYQWIDGKEWKEKNNGFKFKKNWK